MAFNVEILYSINVAFACYKWEQTVLDGVCVCILGFRASFLTFFINVYYSIFCCCCCAKERLYIKWCISLSIFATMIFQQATHDLEQTASLQWFIFLRQDFNLAFEKGAWKWFQEWNEEKKKNKWKFLFRIIANTFFMELNF